MMTVIVVIAALYVAFHVGAGHTSPLPEGSRPQPELLLEQRPRAVCQRAAARRVPGRSPALRSEPERPAGFAWLGASPSP